jgi:hypothetical protein
MKLIQQLSDNANNITDAIFSWRYTNAVARTFGEEQKQDKIIRLWELKVYLGKLTINLEIGF